MAGSHLQPKSLGTTRLSHTLACGHRADKHQNRDRGLQSIDGRCKPSSAPGFVTPPATSRFCGAENGQEITREDVPTVRGGGPGRQGAGAGQGRAEVCEPPTGPRSKGSLPGGAGWAPQVNTELPQVCPGSNLGYKEITQRSRDCWGRTCHLVSAGDDQGAKLRSQDTCRAAGTNARPAHTYPRPAAPSPSEPWFWAETRPSQMSRPPGTSAGDLPGT